ncbi:MAG: response regulator [Elusimicrobia bacterium]|nr:response regulator [Elusimicrobiota bacterium]
MSSVQARPRIFIVDDEAVVRRTITRALAGGDFLLEEAADGEQALRRADAAAPDLVLLDWSMPALSGLEVVLKLRASWRTRLTPILMLTGRGRVEDKELGLESGADDYIVKPFSVRELRARVESQLSRSHDRRQASPLTGLPGPAALEDEIRRRLEGEEPFAVLHADIDRFKIFNDAYGLARGDDAIRLAARCAQEAARRQGADGAFVAHVGGDDFGFVVDAANAECTALDMTLRFDAQSPRLMALSHVCGDVGAEPGCPALSIGIALAVPGGGECVADICAQAGRAKARLKAVASRFSRYAFSEDAGLLRGDCASEP